MRKLQIFILVLGLVIAVSCMNAFADQVTSKVGISIYGKIKLDASYSDSTVHPGNYGVWVDQEYAGGPKDVSQMNMTADETRLGLKFKGPDYSDLETTGIIEMDYYGSAGSETKPSEVLRRAFVNLKWTDMDLSLLAGQEWDVVAPLNPGTLNYTVMFYQGNIQFRRPQIRLTKGFAVSDNVNLLLELALCRNVGTADGAYTAGDTGENAATPIFEYRGAVSFPGLSSKKTTIGLSGATGSQKEYTNATATTDKTYNVSLFAVDLNMPLVEGLGLKGEYWTGKNVSSFLGGIGQGVNTTLDKEIQATGYWAALSYKFADYWHINVGYGCDDPKNDDLNAGDKTKNEITFANVMYDLTESVSLGLEVSDLKTDYKGNDKTADATRIQGSITYSF